MRALLPPALLVLALLLAPSALADHAFSHRVVVEGRVLDAEGRPVPGARPEVTLEGATELGPCLEAQMAETGPTGDFAVCKHVHEMGDGVMAHVRLGNATARALVDPDTRSASVKLRIHEDWPARDLSGERLFDRTLRVEGRVFSRLDAPRDVDGVVVNATPRAGAPVHAMLVFRGALLASANGTTDGEGAYAVDLEVDEIPFGSRVRVETEGAAAVGVGDGAFRRADVDVVRDPRARGTGDERPGSSTGEIPAPGAALVVLLVGLTAAGRRLARRGGGG